MFQCPPCEATFSCVWCWCVWWYRRLAGIAPAIVGLREICRLRSTLKARKVLHPAIIVKLSPMPTGCLQVTTSGLRRYENTLSSIIIAGVIICVYIITDNTTHVRSLNSCPKRWVSNYKNHTLKVNMTYYHIFFSFEGMLRFRRNTITRFFGTIFPR